MCWAVQNGHPGLILHPVLIYPEDQEFQGLVERN